MPPEFEQWCRTSWLPANLGRDFYSKQAETHIQSLAAKIGNLQKEIEGRAGSQIPEQRPHSFALQAPDGQKEQRRHKQSRKKSGDSDSLWSGHAQLIAIGQAGGSASSRFFCW